MGLTVVGVIENIKLIGKTSIKTPALFDTGAKTTSVDIKLAAQAQLGPVVKIIKVKQANTKSSIQRPMVEAIIEIKGKKFQTFVNLQDRSHMTFPVIIGRNILAGNFLVDSKKNSHLFKKYAKDNNNSLKNYI